MLGRKTYTSEELDHARTAIAGQLAAYRRLADAVDATGDPRAQAALEAFEPRFAEALTLALDRHFVHRLRVVAGCARVRVVCRPRGRALGVRRLGSACPALRAVWLAAGRFSRPHADYLHSHWSGVCLGDLRRSYLGGCAIGARYYRA